MMLITERAAAIGRAQRALQALGERPDATRSQLGAARERLNDCYRLSDPAGVWAAVTSMEERVPQPPPPITNGSTLRTPREDPDAR